MDVMLACVLAISYQSMLEQLFYVENVIPIYFENKRSIHDSESHFPKPWNHDADGGCWLKILYYYL